MRLYWPRFIKIGKIYANEKIKLLMSDLHAFKIKNCNRFDLLSYREIDVITSNACTVLPITHVIAVREVTPSRYVMCTTPQL